MIEEDEFFNSEYVEVDRVLGESRFPPPEGSDEPEAVYYLVKWRQLPYDDATWELEADVDKTMIAKYLQYVKPPEKIKVRVFYCREPAVLRSCFAFIAIFRVVFR